MNENAISLAKRLGQMPATEVVRDPQVRKQFIDVFNAVWKQGGEAAYEREAMYFNRQLRESDKLRRCTGQSVFYAFIDLAVKGLTLEPGAQAVCYLLPRNVKTGKDNSGRDLWEQQCNLTISGYGELVLRAKAGQIRHADNPVVVYEGDTFAYGEQDGRKAVSFMAQIPRKSNRIVACFIRITRADGTADYSIMLEDDWLRLRDYSAKNNAYTDQRTGQRVHKPNDLYSSAEGSIDPGFLKAKLIKHAFKTYPKLSIGKGTVLESDTTADEPAKDFDPYAGVETARADGWNRSESSTEPRPVTCTPPEGSNGEPGNWVGGVNIAQQYAEQPHTYAKPEPRPAAPDIFARQGVRVPTINDDIF